MSYHSFSGNQPYDAPHGVSYVSLYTNGQWGLAVSSQQLGAPHTVEATLTRVRDEMATFRQTGEINTRLDSHALQELVMSGQLNPRDAARYAVMLHQVLERERGQHPEGSQAHIHLTGFNAGLTEFTRWAQERSQHADAGQAYMRRAARDLGASGPQVG